MPIVKVVIPVYNLSYVLLFTTTTERNGSLNGSDTAPDDPLSEVRTVLMKLYEDNDTSCDSIRASVHKTETEHKATLGHLAEFWLLLSVGEVLAHPTQTYGHSAGAYRHNAVHCDDISSEVILQSGELVGDLLPARSGHSNIRGHVAAIWAKRPYDDLAKKLEYAA